MLLCVQCTPRFSLACWFLLRGALDAYIFKSVIGVRSTADTRRKYPTSGIVIFGDDELQYTRALAPLEKSGATSYWNVRRKICNLGVLWSIGGVLEDELGTSSAFGACAGTSTLVHHRSRAPPRCLVVAGKGGCGHPVADHAWGLRRGLMEPVIRPRLPPACANSCSSENDRSSDKEVNICSTLRSATGMTIVEGCF